MFRAMDQKLELLAKVPLLSGLDRKDLQEVGRVCDEVDLPEGRVVARQGGHAEEFFVIVDGTVRIDRDGQHLRDLGAGDFFGELALLAKIPRTATATCITPCRLLVLGHGEFNGLLARYPTVQASVLHALAERVALLEHDPRH